jgi:hypothetical protein
MRFWPLIVFVLSFAPVAAAADGRVAALLHKSREEFIS